MLTQPLAPVAVHYPAGCITLQSEVTGVPRRKRQPSGFTEAQYAHLGKIVDAMRDARVLSAREISDVLPIGTGKPLRDFVNECVTRGILVKLTADRYMQAPHITGYLGEDYRRRVANHREEKQRIANYVAWQMKVWVAGTEVKGIANLPTAMPGLLVDAGSSAQAVVRKMIDGAPQDGALPKLYTINLHAAVIALDKIAEVYVPSGRISKQYAAILGESAIADLEEDCPDGCATVLATSGITPRTTLGVADDSQRATKRLLCEKGLSGALIIVTDHHKLAAAFSIFGRADADLRRSVESAAYMVIDQLPEDAAHRATRVREPYAKMLGYLFNKYASSDPDEHRLSLLDQQGNPLSYEQIEQYLQAL